MQLPLPHSSWLCVFLRGHHYTFRDCVSWNRGLPVASGAFFPLSLSLLLLLSQRASSRTTFSASHSPCVYLPRSFSRRLSLRRDCLAPRHLSIVRTYPDEEAAHMSLPGTLVSSPGRVSGARARARCRPRARTRTVHHRFCIQTYAKGREILLAFILNT